MLIINEEVIVLYSVMNGFEVFFVVLLVGKQDEVKMVYVVLILDDNVRKNVDKVILFLNMIVKVNEI